MARRTLHRDTEGLSTTEYVIVLIVVACVGIAAWRLFGASALTRATEASGDVGQLGQSVDGPARPGGGSKAPRSRARGSHLDDAVADATPTPQKEELTMPYLLLAGAALLLAAMVAQRMKKGGGGGQGAKG